MGFRSTIFLTSSLEKLGMERFIIKMGYLTKALSRMIPRMERVWRALLMGLSLEKDMSKMRRMGRGTV